MALNQPTAANAATHGSRQPSPPTGRSPRPQPPPHDSSGWGEAPLAVGSGSWALQSRTPDVVSSVARHCALRSCSRSCGRGRGRGRGRVGVAGTGPCGDATQSDSCQPRGLVNAGDVAFHQRILHSQADSRPPARAVPHAGPPRCRTSRSSPGPAPPVSSASCSWSPWSIPSSQWSLSPRSSMADAQRLPHGGVRRGLPPHKARVPGQLCVLSSVLAPPSSRILAR